MDMHIVGEKNSGVTRGERVDSAFLRALLRWVPGTRTVVLCLGGNVGTCGQLCGCRWGGSPCPGVQGSLLPRSPGVELALGRSAEPGARVWGCLSFPLPGGGDAPELGRTRAPRRGDARRGVGLQAGRGRGPPFPGARRGVGFPGPRVARARGARSSGRRVERPKGTGRTPRRCPAPARPGTSHGGLMWRPPPRRGACEPVGRGNGARAGGRGPCAQGAPRLPPARDWAPRAPTLPQLPVGFADCLWGLHKGARTLPGRAGGGPGTPKLHRPLFSSLQDKFLGPDPGTWHRTPHPGLLEAWKSPCLESWGVWGPCRVGLWEWAQLCFSRDGALLVGGADSQPAAPTPGPWLATTPCARDGTGRVGGNVPHFCFKSF